MAVTPRGDLAGNPSLAVFTFPHTYFDGEKYTTDATFQHMLVPLDQYFEKIYLCCPVVADPFEHGREVIDASLEVVRLPSCRNGLEKYVTRLPALLLSCTRLFLRQRRHWQLVCIVDADIHSEYVYLLCKLFRVPAVLYLRGREERQDLRANRQRGIRRPLSTVLAGWLRLVIPRMVAGMPTVVTGDDLYAFYRGRALAIHLFVSSLVRERELLEAAPRRELRSPVPVILCVARVAPIKGQRYLIEALARLPVDLPARLRLVGPIVEEYGAELRDLARRLGVEQRVEFAGPVPFGPELAAAYTGADIYVQPSLMEGTPKSVIEAMAAGLPIVASAVGGIPHIIKSGHTGCLVPPSDPKAIADAIVALLRDSALSARVGAAAAAAAHELTLDAQLRGLVQFLAHSFPHLHLDVPSAP